MAGIFETIEKLINEHGSAEILRERLALAKDQYDALEKELSECQQEKESLLQRLRQLEENSKLKQVEDKSSDQFADFDDTTHKILKVFFDLSRDVSVEQVGGYIRINRPLLEYHFDLLRGAGFVRQTKIEHAGYRGTSSAMFRITPEGRKYVVKNNI